MVEDRYLMNESLMLGAKTLSAIVGDAVAATKVTSPEKSSSSRWWETSSEETGRAGHGGDRARDLPPKILPGAPTRRADPEDMLDGAVGTPREHVQSVWSPADGSGRSGEGLSREVPPIRG